MERNAPAAVRMQTLRKSWTGYGMSTAQLLQITNGGLAPLGERPLFVSRKRFEVRSEVHLHRHMVSDALTNVKGYGLAPHGFRKKLTARRLIPMDSKNIRRRNLLALKASVGTWVELAAAAGTSPKYFSQIVSEKTDADMGADVARRLEVAYNKPYGWMDRDHEALQEEASGVPVVGRVRAGAERHYLEYEYPVGHGDGRVGYASKDKNAYAVKVEGESMMPRIRPGEYVVAEPGKPYHPGDDVLVSTVTGLKMVKQFLYARDGSVTFDSVNTTYERIVLPATEIASIHFIAAICKTGTSDPD